MWTSVSPCLQAAGLLCIDVLECEGLEAGAYTRPLLSST